MASGLVITAIQGGSQGIHHKPIPNMTVDNLYIESGNLYFGSDSTSGTWRMERNDGVDVDRYESDAWVEKFHHG